MKTAVNPSDTAKSRRPAEHSSFQRFSFQHFSFTQIPLFPRNPLFPALRSGHRLFQRPSPQKQIPISTVVIKIGIAILIGVENKFVANNAGKGFECSVERGLGVAGRENELHDLPVVVRVGVTGLSMNCR